jgi:hypothetical protein
MEHFIINKNGTCGGCVGTQPNDNNWTLTPYLGGFVKEFWNGTQWIENATEQEIAEASPVSLNLNDVIIDLVTKQVEVMSDEEKSELLTLLTV